MEKEYGPLPVNEECCPDCHIYPVDGYMSHLTDCPQRAKERQIRAHMATNPPSSQGLETEEEYPSELWAEYIWRQVAWRWKQIEWKTVLFVAVAIGVTCVLLWLGLGAIEKGR